MNLDSQVEADLRRPKWPSLVSASMWLLCAIFSLVLLPACGGCRPCAIGTINLPHFVSSEMVRVVLTDIGAPTFNCTWTGAWACDPEQGLVELTGSPKGTAVFVRGLAAGSRPKFAARITTQTGTATTELVSNGQEDEPNSCDCVSVHYSLPDDAFAQAGAVIKK